MNENLLKPENLWWFHLLFFSHTKAISEIQAGKLKPEKLITMVGDKDDDSVCIKMLIRIPKYHYIVFIIILRTEYNNTIT